jgi:transmembrane protein EpsG
MSIIETLRSFAKPSKSLMTQRNAKIITILIAFPLILLSSIRWKTGTDWIAYESIYRGALQISILNENLEPLYIVIIKILRSISENFTLYIAFLSVACIGMKAYAITKFNSPLIGALLFFVSFQLNMYAVRYDIALSLVLFAGVIDIKQRSGERNHYVFLNHIAAIGIHKVAIVAFILHLLGDRAKTNLKKFQKIILYTILIALIYYYFNQESFQYKIASGVFQFKINETLTIKTLHRFWYLAMILILLRISRPNEVQKKYLNFLIVGAVFYVLIGFFNFGSIERIFGIFLIYEMLFFSNVRILNRNAYFITFFSTIGIIRIYQFLSSDYMDIFFPYETILEIKFKDVY